jgi:hypothetical protein
MFLASERSINLIMALGNILLSSKQFILFSFSSLLKDIFEILKGYSFSNTLVLKMGILDNDWLDLMTVKSLRNDF